MQDKWATDMAGGGLIERWEARQAQLATLLEACGATEGERHIAWGVGRVAWENAAGERVASADMKALCSYSYPDRSLLMAWANEEAGGAVIAPVPDVPDLIETCEEPEAWLWAMRLAEESQAEYLYRVASPNYLVFLGLWNVLPTADAEAFDTVDLDVEPGSPFAFVLDLLDEVQAALEEQRTDPAALRRLFINRGESLLQNAQYLYSDRSDGGLLRRTGNALIEMGNSFGQRRFGVLPPAALSEGESESLQQQLTRLRVQWIRAGRQSAAISAKDEASGTGDL